MSKFLHDDYNDDDKDDDNDDDNAVAIPRVFSANNRAENGRKVFKWVENTV